MKLMLVSNYTEALAVALIRNECREYMTHDTRLLTVNRQIKFYKNTPKGISVFLAVHNGLPVGYAVIRCVRGQRWITGGLAKGFRGKGIGKQLFQEIIAICRRPAWLDVRRTNRRAIRLYRKLGFETVNATKRLLVMKLA